LDGVILGRGGGHAVVGDCGTGGSARGRARGIGRSDFG
jgi:hypothetical protein